MTFIGIDPGSKGGVSVITDKEVYSYIYSDENLKTTLTEYKDDKVFCVVEKVGAMPGQGVTSMFNFGKAFGYILGMLEANNIPYQLVTPQTWKKEFMLIHKDKNESIKVCKRLFPNVNLLPTSRCKKESDGMAESLLISEYARRIYKCEK